MRQILQDLRNGETQLTSVPAPLVMTKGLLIQSVSSLLSIGTEKMLIEFGKASWVNKARRQPEKVLQVIDKIKTDGLVTTLNAVNSKLDQAIPLGYSNVGRVIEVGEGIEGYIEGDLVVSNGPHANIVRVEKHLCAKVPDGLTPDQASFTIVGSIGLQGIRLLKPSLGECFVVTGLGLIGLLSVQILRAHGCRVIGIDFDSRKCALAKRFGAEICDLSAGQDPLMIASHVTSGRGVDGVLITASTKSNEPVHQGAQMCRKRGRIVLVGLTGLELLRSDFYEKELSFQVSCSYGPGRYDPEYEGRGQDYPIGFVRWTEQRNFEAVLRLMTEGKLDVEPLISHRYAFDDALEAYKQIDSPNTLGIILSYDDLQEQPAFHLTTAVKLAEQKPEQVVAGCFGVIGAGGFVGQVLVPALARTDARLKSVVSSKGVTGTQLGRKFGFEISTTDSKTVVDDDEIDTVLVATRHNSHASLALEALEAGKHVFVEKPLCVNPDELNRIVEVYSRLDRLGRNPFLMVGFNRRFAPHVVKAKQLFEGDATPKAMNMVVNAGFIPSDHWTQDPRVGGGRIVGEGCHFIDLLRFLADSPISLVRRMACQDSTKSNPEDTVSIQLGFENGSTGTIQYLANGNRMVAKERLEIFCGGKVLMLNNFRQMRGYGFEGFKKMNLWRQDKGHQSEMSALVSVVRSSKPSPIPFSEIVEVTRASFSAAGLVNPDYVQGMPLGKSED